MSVMLTMEVHYQLSIIRMHSLHSLLLGIHNPASEGRYFGLKLSARTKNNSCIFLREVRSKGCYHAVVPFLRAEDEHS